MSSRHDAIWIALGLVACVALAAYTSSKLYKMARIRGFAGDAGVAVRIVSDKSSEPARRLRDEPTCWLHWSDDRGNQRVQSDCDYWHGVRVGDPIEIVTVGDGDVYLKRGEIYASGGNFMFDFVLLGLEITGVVACIVLLVRRRRKR